MTAPETTAPLTARPLTRDDAPAMRVLFAEVFGKEMSQALWDWKYARPHSVAYGVWRGDKLIAHYGGMGLHVWYKGIPGISLEICDVMVNISGRQAVRKGSPFFLATSGFIEHFVGYHNPFLFGFGFPSDRHMALAAHLKLYAPVGRMWELSWSLPAQPRMPLLLKTEKVDLDSYPRQRAQLDALGDMQRADLGDRVAVRKDAAYIDWRYLRHPQERYELLLVKHRLSGKPIGLCVFKAEAERTLWLDAIAPLGHLPALAQVARVAAWRMQQRKLALWCSAPDIERFGGGADARELPIVTPANIWTEGPSPESLQDRWWLVAGDTDWL